MTVASQNFPSVSAVTVLVVEDDHDTRVALRETLESLGYDVVTAASGIDALARLRSMNPPLVILMDQNMPLMNGDELLRILRHSADYRDIPVIAISAVADRLTALGAVTYISKPVTLDALKKALGKYVRQNA